MPDRIPEEQFVEWLPFYVNGTLGAVERAAVEQYLHAHPSARTALTIEQTLRRIFSETMNDVDVDLNKSRFMAQVRTVKPQAERSNTETLLGRILNGLGVKELTPLVVVLGSLLIVETGLLGLLSTRQSGPETAPTSPWRAVETANTVSGPVLQIAFKPEATEEAMRLLLVRIQGRLVGGPGQLGIYLVHVQANDIERARHEVEQADICKEVKVLDKMPN